MNRSRWIGLAIACGMLTARAGYSEMNFVVDARPASILINTGDEYKVDGTDGRVSGSTYFIMPNVSAGLGFELGESFLDVTGGGGVLINDTFRSWLLQADAALMFAASESLMMGPRGGLVYFFDPSWTENDDLDFDEAWGWQLGFQIVMGDKIQYLVSVDYLAATFDADKKFDVVADDEFDLTGIAFQFGVRGEF